MWSNSPDLVGRLTTAEKISQLGNTAPAIERLKIPAYQWWSEALHGIARSPGVHFEGNVREHSSEFVFLHQTNRRHVHGQKTFTNRQMLSIRTQCLFFCRSWMPPPSHKLSDLVQPSTCMRLSDITTRGPVSLSSSSLLTWTSHAAGVCLARRSNGVESVKSTSPSPHPHTPPLLWQSFLTN